MDDQNIHEGETTEEKVEHTLSQTDKKCPDCGGTMDFDPKTGALLCPYCGNIVEIEDGEEEPERAEELSFDDAEYTGNCDWGTEKRVIRCKSCGAETIYDASVVSGECPYCGSNQVMEAGAEHILAPGGVCPFGVKEGIKVYLDESLKRFDTVYPAAGNDHSAVRLTIEDLENAVDSEGWIDVCKEIEV